ncbi:MAG TPA: tRNA (guanosine(18)-2'-O)-methyltransferase TrmH [Acidobacteriota bacterium]|nr:tRNA (guanosine(18)-2'-O)-methyltransferase TrmH [Acidobacteriota bacterium]
MTPERYQRIRRVLDHRQPDLTIIFENLKKPHNFSALLRTCDAVGIGEAFAVWPQGEIGISPSISGNTANWVRTRTFPSLGKAVEEASGRGMRVLAANVEESSTDFREVDFTRPTALLLGQELHGLTDQMAPLADQFITIPTVGMGDSLNVSVAAAVILFEVRRQREAAGFYDQPRLTPEEYQRLLFEWGYPEVEEYCRRKGIPYPQLREDGQIVDWEERA